VSTYPAIYAANMTEQQRAIYYAELSVVQKDEVLGVMLAVFLGTFGAHQFYMRRTGLGILYCILSVTGFSTIAGFVEAFFMPERVRRFNAAQAAAIATHLGFYPGAVPAGFSPNAPAFNPPPYAPANPPPFTPTYSAVPASSTLPPPVPSNAPTVCPACGEPLAEGVKFCSRCGASVQA